MPPLFASTRVPHYHGDEIRRLFIACAAVWLIAVPVIGEPLPWGMDFQIAIILVFVALAGFTAPHSSLIIIVDTTLAAGLVFLLEAAAIHYFHSDSAALFFVREILAVMLLFALYAGVKTLRAMAQGKLGKTADRGEFGSPEQKK